MFKYPTRGEIREVVGRRKPAGGMEEKEKEKGMGTREEKDRERLQGGSRDIIQQKPRRN